MLVIREEQMEVLSKYMLKQFEDRMVIHLNQNFPDETKNISESDLRETISTSIDKAAKYDVTDETDVERYLEYAVRYDPDFDTNPNLPWATKILGDENLTGTEKMNQLDDYELFVLQLGGQNEL
jgi:hypothetical protein